MKKRFVAIFVTVLMLFATVTTFGACNDDSKTINVVLLSNQQEGKFYREYFSKMEKTLKEEGFGDFKIVFRGYKESDYYDNILDPSIGRNAAPDIFYIRPNEIIKYQNSIVPLQDYAYGEGADYADLNDIYQSALDMYRYNTETKVLGNHSDPLYAFPKDLSVQQLGYYRPLLEKFTNAIKTEYPTYKMPWEMDFTTSTYTWEQYKNICKVIADNAGSNEYPSDVPPLEVLVKSFGGDLIDIPDGNRSNGTINSLTDTNGAIYKAMRYQAELIDCGAADYDSGTYSNFSAKRVCFYGIVGSWEVAEYNQALGSGNWDVMPWPTVDGGTNWQGVITSAGYVVSKKCAESKKFAAAKRIAISFLSGKTQDDLVRKYKISLPLIADSAQGYRDNEEYDPAGRGYFLDVISKQNGFYPARYSTYDAEWLKPLSNNLTEMYEKGKGHALTYFNSMNFGPIQNNMQQQYNASKNN